MNIASTQYRTLHAVLDHVAHIIVTEHLKVSRREQHEVLDQPVLEVAEQVSTEGLEFVLSDTEHGSSPQPAAALGADARISPRTMA
jgi:hypothetical protein